MHESYFQVATVQHENREPQGSVYFVDPKHDHNTLKAINRVREQRTLLQFGVAVGGVITLVATILFLVNYTQPSLIAASLGLIIIGALQLLDSRLKYKAGEDYYTLTIPVETLASLKELKRLSRGRWLQVNEERAIAAVLLRVQKKEISSQSSAMLDAFNDYRVRAENRKNEAETKLVSDAMRQNDSEA